MLRPAALYAYEHPGGLHPRQQIEYVKRQLRQQKEPYISAFAQLKRKADSALSEGHHAMADFHIPGFYIDQEGHRRNSLALNTDGFCAYSCALAWQLTGQKKYAEKAVYFLNAWASLNKQYSEADGPLVMAYSGASLVIAGELMREYKAWKKKDRDQFAVWLTGVYRKACRSISVRKNNWGDWGRYGAMLADYYLDDSLDMKENIRLLCEDLPAKIGPDGHLIEEVKREKNGIWYTYFALSPISGSFWIGNNATGQNLFRAPEGELLKKALDYLLYYNQHPDEWKWYPSPRQGKMDATNTFWPANLIEAMSGVYGEDKYVQYVRPFRPLVYQSHHFVWTYPTLMPLRIGRYQDR